MFCISVNLRRHCWSSCAVQRRPAHMMIKQWTVLSQPVIDSKELSIIFSICGPVIYTNGGPLLIVWMVIWSGEKSTLRWGRNVRVDVAWKKGPQWESEHVGFCFSFFPGWFILSTCKTHGSIPTHNVIPWVCLQHLPRVVRIRILMKIFFWVKYLLSLNA